MLPHGGIEPRSIYDALATSPGHPDAPPTLYTGLQFGDYGFLGPGLSGARADVGGLGPGYRFVTWQVGPAVRHLARAGRVGVLPVRFRDIPRVFGPGGRLAADVAVIQCTPPRDGKVNLGVSCSIFPSMVASASLVIAEIHPDMPWTAGATELPVSAVDLAVDASAPLGTLARAKPDEIDERIIARVRGLIPDDAWVQLGVGAIPDAILGRLHEHPKMKLHSGMLTDPLIEFLDGAGQGRAHSSQVGTGHPQRALPEVDVENLVGVVGQHTEAVQHVGDGAVAAAGGLLRAVDVLVELKWTACAGRVEVPDLGEPLVGSRGGYQGDRGDRPGVDHRVLRCLGLVVHADLVERLPGGLHADLGVHGVLADLVERQGIGEWLRYRLDGEFGSGVA